MWLAVGVALLGGCDPKAAAVDGCKVGQLEACERACDLGVGDEGGCMAAGIGWLRKRHISEAVPYDPNNHEPHKQAQRIVDAAFERAEAYYGSACDLGVGDGCLYTVALHDHQFQIVPNPDTDGSMLTSRLKQPLMDMRALARRRTTLQRACALGSHEGCRRLGASFVGEDHATATDAFERSCRLTGDSSDTCLERERRLVPRAAELAHRCEQPKADDCNALAALIFTVDPARAPMIWAKAHRIRGMGDWGLARHIAFSVSEALWEAQRGYEEERAPSGRQPAETPPPTPEQVEEAAAKLEVRLSEMTVDRAYSEAVLREVFDRLRPALLRCYAISFSNHAATAASWGYLPLRGRVMVRFVIDPTGDPFSLAGGGDIPDGAVVNCAVRLFEDLSLPPPKQGPVRVSLPIDFRPKK
jgi:hypothetical protein